MSSPGAALGMAVLAIDELRVGAGRGQRVNAAGDRGVEQRGDAARSLMRVSVVFARDLQQREERRLASIEVNDLNNMQGPGKRQQPLDLREPANQYQPPAIAASATARVGDRADA